MRGYCVSGGEEREREMRFGSAQSFVQSLGLGLGFSETLERRYVTLIKKLVFN